MGKLCNVSETCDLHSVLIYIRRQKLRLLANIVAAAVTTQKANKYLYTVVYWHFDMFEHSFSSNHFIQILYLFIYTTPLLRIFGNLCPLINPYSGNHFILYELLQILRQAGSEAVNNISTHRTQQMMNVFSTPCQIICKLYT